MLKQYIYKLFLTKWINYRQDPLFSLTAKLLEKIFGLAAFHYGGVKLLAGPVGYLDAHIILGININPYVTSALSQYLINGGVFLDIGANHGVFSLLAAKNPKTQIFAFEPSPRELTRLWKNLQLNEKNSINVFAYGLGEEEKEQDFVLSQNDNPGRNSLPTICEEGERIECRFSTLTKLLSTDILKQVRVCKLDVEGQEMFILNSLRSHMHLLEQCVFIVEISPQFLSKIGFSVNDIYQFFEQAGFKHQFGKPDNALQWDDFFYHPSHASELVFSENFN